MNANGNTINAELDGLNNAITNLDIIKNISTYSLPTLLRYFPDKKDKISQCYEGEQLKEDKVEACQDIISQQLSALLRPYIEKGYKVADVAYPDSHIILQKDDNSENNVGISIGLYNFFKSVSPYTVNNEDVFIQGIKNDSHCTIQNGVCICLPNNRIAYKRDAKIITFSYHTDDQNNNYAGDSLVDIKLDDKYMNEYFDIFLPSLTLEEIKAYINNLDDEVNKMAEFENQDQWLKVLNNARKCIEDARKEQANQQNENNSINNFNFNKEDNVVNKVEENNKGSTTNSALNNNGKIINNNNINESSNNTEEKDKKLNSNSSFNQNLDNNNIYSFNQYTFINNNNSQKDNSGPILDVQESNHGCPCPCTCLDAIYNWCCGKGKEGQ